MSWYVKVQSEESKRHIASTTYHGPMSHYSAQAFKCGIEYVDDPTISVEVVPVHKIPHGASIMELKDESW